MAKTNTNPEPNPETQPETENQTAPQGPLVKTISKTQDAEGRKVIEGLTTKSAQIRALHAKGWSRGDISRFLTIVHGKTVRYQHVRNVLVTPLMSAVKG